MAKDNEKDFHVKTIDEDRLFDKIPGVDEDEELAEEMFNYGDEGDLPDSDRAWEDDEMPDMKDEI